MRKTLLQLGPHYHFSRAIIELFYDNCIISRALIGSFLSSIRVPTDKIIIYASFQQLNVQLSNCQLFDQRDFIDFFKEPIKEHEKLLTMLASF